MAVAAKTMEKVPLLAAIPIALAWSSEGGHIDYSRYPGLFSRAIGVQGNVDYSYLKSHRGDLDSFLHDVARLDRESYEHWSRRDKTAFWINVHNAFAIKIVLDNYPIKGNLFTSLLYPDNSIKQIAGSFEEAEITVMGKSMTLDQIRDDVLRGEIDDPRVHMALVYGARGCPRLPGTYYEGESLDAWLRFQAESVVKDSTMVRIDMRNNRLYLSEMFQWYGEDFIGEYGDIEGFESLEPAAKAVVNFLARYVKDKKEREFVRDGGYEVVYMDFDWTLNEEMETPLTRRDRESTEDHSDSDTERSINGRSS